jgi:hypothetical protein
MLIDQYYNSNENSEKISISRQQASDFAKSIADDFNPLHDVETKRFCVPGDLLFSLVLSKYGVSNHMEFTFSGMVTEKVTLNMPVNSPELSFCGDNGKEYLAITTSGSNSSDTELIDSLTRSYVTFSGHTFPHILVPLMKKEGVMINPKRPMLMYQSMLLDIKNFNVRNINLELDHEKTQLVVKGKRGNICLAFNLKSNNEIIGCGEKHMIASGLMAYEQEAIEEIINNHNQWKQAFKA